MPISGATIPFISSQRRGSRPSNFAIVLVFLISETCKKISFSKQADCSLTTSFSGPKSSGDFRETGPWPVVELKGLDREARKVIVGNGGKHSLGSTSLLYLPRVFGGRGLKSVEREYEQTKIKAVARLYRNEDPAMKVVRQFMERSEGNGRRSMVKDTKIYASEFRLKLSLAHPQPLITCLMKDEEVPVKKIGVWLKTAAAERDVEELKVEGWQGSLLSERWEDQEVGEECFSWMSE